MQAPKNRILWLDYTRITGMVLVVFGHCLRGLITDGIVPHHSFTASLDYFIYTFHMPLFFLLAGLNVSRSFTRGRTEFFLDKLTQLAYPYILWSLLQGSIQLFLSKYTNHALTAHSLTSILWAPIGQFWFLYALLICHFIVFLIGIRPRYIALSAIVCLVASSFLISLHGEVFIFSTLYCAIFYLCGILFNKFIMKPRTGSAFSWTVFVSSLVVYIPGSMMGHILSNNEPYSLTSLPAAISGIFIMISLCQLLEIYCSQHLSWLARMGTMSMTIYILHILVIVFCRVVLLKSGVHNIAILLGIMTATGVLVPVCIHLCLERLSWLKYSGFIPLKFKWKSSKNSR